MKNDLRSAADLTREQITDMQESLRGPSVYLRRLRDRMLECGFPKDDKLLVEAEQAFNAIHGLSVTLHYIRCEKLKPGTTGGAGVVPSPPAGTIQSPDDRI